MPNNNDYTFAPDGTWLGLREKPANLPPVIPNLPQKTTKQLSQIMIEALDYKSGLVGDIVQREAITIISGVSGDGKTTLIYNLAASASKGQKFLTFDIPTPLKVLYYDLESPDTLIKSRCQLIKDIDFSNISIGRFENFIKQYRQLVEESKRFDIVIIDPIALAFQTIKEEDNAEASRQMKLLRRFVTDTKAALILVHHLGKMAQGKAVYKLRGATARAAESDIVINFESVSDDICRLEVAKNRFVGGNLTLFVEKTEGTFQLTRFKDYADSCEVFKAQQAILEFLEPVKCAERKDIIINLSSFNSKTLDRAITSLLQTGKLDKPRFGYYCLKGESPL